MAIWPIAEAKRVIFPARYSTFCLPNETSTSLPSISRFPYLAPTTECRFVWRFTVEACSRCGLTKDGFWERHQPSDEAYQRGDFHAAVCLYGNAQRANPQNCILYTATVQQSFWNWVRVRVALDDAVKARLFNPQVANGSDRLTCARTHMPPTATLPEAIDCWRSFLRKSCLIVTSIPAIARPLFFSLAL
ncbi:hypothetical protein DPEC_G00264040 [Dallia pectoralis]|uniref:Uncharacterized protein n=1 Tax=Dallia pectoralis TaxID=75939 RepID=A0ACC2FSP2_DALPE|nr:hypothetical protein DPEC_G00264040 [Dallia pectoralis]